jgi:hypothetical protein
MVAGLCIAGYFALGIVIALALALWDSAVTGESCARVVLIWPVAIGVYLFDAMSALFDVVCYWAEERRRKRASAV